MSGTKYLKTLFFRRGEPGTPKRTLDYYFLKTISSIFKTFRAGPKTLDDF